MDALVEQAIALFHHAFGTAVKAERDACTVVAAPGRVNFIGEHTDYNDGFVLPLALDRNTVIVGMRNNHHDATGGSRVVSTAFPDHVVKYQALRDHPDMMAPSKRQQNDTQQQQSWGNYIRGVAAMYLQHCGLQEMNVYAAIVSDVPVGSGLSSSASLEVAFATLLESLFGISNISRQQKALLCQQAEHAFCHVPCGIMDQFIASFGEEGCALLIDCRSKEAVRVALQDPNIVLVVCNSNVHHQLAGSEYTDRVRQCHEAVRVLRTQFPQMTHLRDVTLDQLAIMETCFEDAVVYRRARHVVSENARTLAAVQLLGERAYDCVGQLMLASHRSLQCDYEVSTPELDVLVDTAMQCDGVYGARMTGGGFGGCIIALVRRDATQQVMQALENAYTIPFAGQSLKKPTSFVSCIGDGARVLRHPVATTTSVDADPCFCCSGNTMDASQWNESTGVKQHQVRHVEELSSS